MNVISEALLKAVIARKPVGEDIATFLPRELAKISELMTALDRIRANEASAARIHEQTMNELKRCRRSVQMECKHYQTTYHPDASGGRDDSRTCDLCGAELAT